MFFFTKSMHQNLKSPGKNSGSEPHVVGFNSDAKGLKDCGAFRPLGTTLPMTQHHILKCWEPLSQTTLHYIPEFWEPLPKQQSITSQNVHWEPLAARQHSITSQNIWNHLLPGNTRSHPETLGTTCCQATLDHI